MNSAPLTSIIIPFHNCWELTAACLDSIRKNTAAPYEIVLIDDASDPEIAEKARALQGETIRLIRNETRRSFSENNNQGAKAARGRTLCLLNNDTLVTPGWLGAMEAVLEREPDIGVLGNKHLFPGSELLHHCGMAADSGGHPYHLHPNTPPGDPAVNYRRDIPMVTFACAMIPKPVYEKLGGLDESYRNGFEDCDFCLRAREAGFRVTYTPASVIYHYGQSTPGRKQTDESNRQLFQQRWGSKIERNFETISRADREYNEIRAQRKRLQRPPPAGLHLAVDFRFANAFTWATVDLALALQDQGVGLSLPPAPSLADGIPPEKARRLKPLMRGKPRGTYHVKWSHFWPNHMKQELYGDINAEFYCSNFGYPKGELQVDLWLRSVKLDRYRKIPVSKYNLDILLDAGLAPRDCTVVPLGYSPEVDARFPQGRVGGTAKSQPLQVLVVTNSHDLYRYGTDILIGALGEAFGPDDPVVVHIKDYGQGSEGGAKMLRDWIREQKRFPRIEWHTEFLTKEALIDLYARMDVQIAPFRGEGFAMKIIDSMALGVPVMMPLFGGPSEYAADGTFIPLEYDMVPVGQCADLQHLYLGKGATWCEVRRAHLVQQLKSLVDGREKLESIGQAARRHVHGSYSWASSAERLMRALKGWQTQRELTISTRRRPDRVPISVIIPTRDRPKPLEMTLKGFAGQSVPLSSFEILVVSDHGDEAQVTPVIRAAAAQGLNVRLFHNAGPEGPSAGRNVAIPHAAGELAVFVGDDIIPEPTFLQDHLDGHRKFPCLEQALVGLTLWHPDLPRSLFREMITGEGGQQFNYLGMKAGRRAGFDRFFTSNCSIKRAFLIEEETLFDDHLVAHEDKELAYRLQFKGFELRFWPKARTYHYHDVTARSYVGRQRMVGNYTTELVFVRPSYIPHDHAAFLDALEFARKTPALQESLKKASVNPDQLLESLLQWYETILASYGSLGSDAGNNTLIGNRDRDLWGRWLNKGAVQVWEVINELALRIGMAETWCRYREDVDWAKVWTTILAMPRVMGESDLYWKFAIPPDARKFNFFFGTAHRLLQHPLTASVTRGFLNSKLGKKARSKLLRSLEKSG